MRTYRNVLVIFSLGLTACGDRSLPTSDGGVFDGAAIPDSKKLKPDTRCVRPPGGCFSSKDCAPGHTCQGCGGDPCCPTCAVCYGKCVPTKAPPPVPSCKSNKDCPANQYCHMASCQLLGKVTGKCAVRPQNCTSHKDPVCGCDGKTHGNPCAANWAGVNVAYKGKCKSCSQLNTDYSNAVVQAKSCNPLINKISCTVKVNNNLGCPCPTFIENSNTAAVASMNTAKHNWDRQGCIEWDCGMSCGSPPKSAACVGRSANGVCTDQY